MDPSVASPQEAPVWEITGAEFSKSEMHTADGISIRFPRMTRIRDDKDWKSATNLHQLKVAVLSPMLALAPPGPDGQSLPPPGTLPHLQRELRLQGDNGSVR